MMVKMSDVRGFVIDLKKVIYGLRFNLILKRKVKNIALCRIKDGASAVAADGDIVINDIS